MQHTQGLIKNWARSVGKSEWRLRKAVASINTIDDGAGNNLGLMLELTRNFLRELETIRCLECDGWGHTSKRCPTRKKIVAFSACSGATRTFVNQSRNKIFESYGGR